MTPAITSTNWAGGILYDSADNNVFEVVDIDTTEITYGSVAAATPAPLTLWTLDKITVINVVITNGTALTSCTLAQMLNGSNTFFMGGEQMAFANATLQGDGSYNIDTLLRGLRGTEGFCRKHQASETFILTDVALRRQVQPTSVIDVTQYFRGITLGQPVSSGSSTPTVLEANDLMPYAPAQFNGSIDGSNNINITWERRTRVGGAWIGGTGTVPVSEESESYDLEIRLGTTSTQAHDTEPTNPVVQNSVSGGSIHTVVQPFTATWDDGVSADYLGHDFGVLAPGTYYITVSDSTRVGETIGALKTYDASTSTILATSVGYTFCGVIIVVASVAGVGGIGGSPIVKRTITGLTTNSYQYTSAQQTTDFGGNQTTVYGRVYQNSASVGRGFPTSNPGIGNGVPVSGGSDATSILGVPITGTAADGDILQYNVNANEWQIVGPLLKRQTLTKTTASLANNASETGTFVIGCGTFAMLYVSVDRSARVQFYATAALRDADAGRDSNTPPADSSMNGCIADFNLNAGGAETWTCSPPLLGANTDTSPADQIYYRITNTSGGTHTVAATVIIVPLEVI
jgi:hypothetical protein